MSRVVGLLALLAIVSVAESAISYSPTRVPLRMYRPSHELGRLSVTSGTRVTGFTLVTDGLLRLSVLRGTDTVAAAAAPGGRVHLPANSAKGEFVIRGEIAADMALTSRVRVALVAVEIDGKAEAISGAATYRPAVHVRDQGDEGSKGHRIPALVRTRQGTLIAAYDVRYEGMRDLQGHIDIGLNRSSDGGRTWSRRIIALDMGTYGGLPEAYNGVSDAALLVDEKTGRIFCFALWMHGVNDSKGNWVGAKGWTHQWRTNGSMPGFDIRGSSQFMMSVSDDDGLTWSAPRNLTRTVKRDAAWCLYAPAPGNGIMLRDGTLVLPTQGLDHARRQFSTIMLSTDRGETWHTAMPANNADAGQFANECAVVELNDGAIMLNTRDPSRKKMRGVYITRDRGETWDAHPTDHKALVEPTCMASLIRHGDLLLFSNPNSQTARTRMTIKVSEDQGLTWPTGKQILLDEKGGAYSCITPIGDSVGILYESSQAQLLFQRVSIADLLANE